MDQIASRYHRIADEFVIRSHRSRSPALRIVYLRLAGHYEMLARFRASDAIKALMGGSVASSDKSRAWRDSGANTARM
jgi:hypothetical protein